MSDSRRKSTEIIQAASDEAEGLHVQMQYTKTCIHYASIDIASKPGLLGVA